MTRLLILATLARMTTTRAFVDSGPPRKGDTGCSSLNIPSQKKCAKIFQKRRQPASPITPLAVSRLIAGVERLTTVEVNCRRVTTTNYDADMLARFQSVFA
jgi:hypothetical protein